MADTQPTYAEIQARATELGIPAGGKKREFLEAAIAEAEGVNAVDAALFVRAQTATPADGSMSEPIEGDPDGEPGPEVEQVDEPVEVVTGSGGEQAEGVGSGGVVVHWNCSAGDLDGATLEEINQHITVIHA